MVLTVKSEGDYIKNLRPVLVWRTAIIR